MLLPPPASESVHTNAPHELRMLVVPQRNESHKAAHSATVIVPSLSRGYVVIFNLSIDTIATDWQTKGRTGEANGQMQTRWIEATGEIIG